MKKNFIEDLKIAKLKITPARLFVLSVFSSQCKPLNALDILKKIKGKDINQVTAYRTLSSLEKVGILNRVDLRKDAVFYELASHHHHHIICTLCGKIEEFEQCEIKELESSVIKHSAKFKTISGHSLEFFGLCDSCVNRIKI